MSKLIYNLTQEKNILILLSLYIFLLLFACSKMSPLYVTNEWADPNIYFNVAKGMVNGKTLYTEIFDHKGPLIFFIYGAGYIISNDTFFGMFIIQVITWLLMAYSIYFTSRLYFNKSGAFLTTIFFFVFLAKTMKAGGSAEEFILCYEIISLYFFIKYFKDNAVIHKPVYMFVHGMMVTAVLLIKINLIVFWFFPLLVIFLNILIHKEFKNFIYNVLAYLAGTVLISTPVLWYLWSHDALQEAFNIYIELNRSYAKIGSPLDTLLLLLVRLLYFFIEPTSLMVVATIGIFLFPFNHIKNRAGKWSLMLAGLILYSVIFMGLKFQYYYPIPYLVFCVPGLINIGIFLRKYISVKLTFKPLLGLTLLFVVVGMSVTKMSNTRIEELFFQKQNFASKTVMTAKLRDEIMKEKNPTLLNLGFGLANNLFTTCNIVPNVKYFVRPNLSYSFYPELRNEQFRYIKEKKTDFVIIQEYMTGSVYYQSENPVDRPNYLKKLPILNKNYRLILSDTITNNIDENSAEIYYLYKKR